MSATITDTLKLNFLQTVYDKFLNDSVAIGDSDRFWVGIGRSETWPNDSDIVIGIDASPQKERDFRLSMQSVKLITDVTFTVPRVNWSRGSIYSPYDDKRYGGITLNPVLGEYPFYVLTDENNVFICLKQGRTEQGIAVPSTVRPETNTGEPFELDDGYVWKYLYNIGSFEANRFLSSNFMPVQNVDSDTAVTPSEVDQVLVKKRAVDGQLLGIAIDNGGSGYDDNNPPALTIQGNGSGAIASCIVSGGQIVDVFFKDSADGTFSESNLGSGYDFAGVKVASGDAVLRTILSKNRLGIGDDPRIDLHCRGAMLNSKLEGDENGDFLIDQSFRQVGLFQNLRKDSAQYLGFTGDSSYSTPTGFGLKFLLVDSSANFVSPEGELLEGQSSLAQAYIDYWDNTNSKLYYHQNEATGFAPFTTSEIVQATNGAGSGQVDSAGIGGYGMLTDVDKFSGDLLYIDNRASIERDAEQTEDIKIVIQL
jgi:hypothetical protein